jgi:phage host-nuclease inhibitor protein Gam
MARPKKSSMELLSLDECTRAMGKLLTVTLQLEKLIANRDLGVAQVQASYEKPLDALRAEASDLELAMQNYYMSHVSDIEKGGKKSLQLQNGIMGRKLSPAKLVLLNKSWTWASVLTKLRIGFGDRFIRQADPEVAKDTIKAELPEGQMADYGLKLHQDENFYAEPARLPPGGEA